MAINKPLLTKITVLSEVSESYNNFMNNKILYLAQKWLKSLRFLHHVLLHSSFVVYEHFSKFEQF